jgi:small-conductance mechanosensitive channel
MKIMSEMISSNPVGLRLLSVCNKVQIDAGEPKVQVLVGGDLGEFSIALRATVWIKTIDESFVTCSDLRIGIKEQFAENEIEIPYNKMYYTAAN